MCGKFSDGEGRGRGALTACVSNVARVVSVNTDVTDVNPRHKTLL